VFTSINDNSVGGVTGNGSPTAGDWGGLQLSYADSSDRFKNVVLEYASTAISVGVLSALEVVDTEFSNNDAAFDVQGTSDNDPALAVLPCVPLYLSFIDATNDWFGVHGILWHMRPESGEATCRLVSDCLQACRREVLVRGLKKVRVQNRV